MRLRVLGCSCRSPRHGLPSYPDWGLLHIQIASLAFDSGGSRIRRTVDEAPVRWLWQSIGGFECAWSVPARALHTFHAHCENFDRLHCDHGAPHNERANNEDDDEASQNGQKDGNDTRQPAESSGSAGEEVNHIEKRTEEHERTEGHGNGQWSFGLRS